MTVGRGSEIQRAIDFLTCSKAGEMDASALPPRPDYDALANRAREFGYDLSPEAVQQAFQLVMRARLLA